MTLTVRPDLEKRLAAVAGELRRDPQDVLDDMIAASIEDEAAFLAAVQEGKDAAARGEGIPHDEVFANLEKKLLDKYGIRV
jgi:predicted transcriptional regulator